MRLLRFRLAGISLALATAACVSSRGTQSAGVSGPETQVVSDRLFFGLAIPGGGMVADSAWRSFLRDVVTPAFPEGLTVWRAEGQWLDPRGNLVREPAVIVEVLHPRGTPADSVFERIATEYRVRFKQDAVLRATTDARMRMYEQPSKKPD
jgi:hypothetical protein